MTSLNMPFEPVKVHRHAATQHQMVSYFSVCGSLSLVPTALPPPTQLGCYLKNNNDSHVASGFHAQFLISAPDLSPFVYNNAEPSKANGHFKIAS